MDESVKQAIVDAAFRLMQKKDMNSISIREITKEAGVNVAAISYYFGGKAELFAYMMELYWQDLVDLCTEILEKEEITPKEAKVFCARFVRKEMSSTGILRSEQIMYQNYTVDAKTQERIQLQFQAMKHLITQCNKSLTPKQVQMEIVSLLSSLTHPALWNEIAESMVGDVDSFIEAYTDYLIEQLRKNV